MNSTIYFRIKQLLFFFEKKLLTEQRRVCYHSCVNDNKNWRW
nr:MAG TPA: hypothetical protein [Caudoviricetes sp.]